MRPINSRERRSQFLIFILLFFATICPIVLLVHLYSKVDQAENEYLRQQLALNKKVAGEVEAKMSEMKNKEAKFKELSTWLKNRGGELNELETDHSGSLRIMIDATDVSQLTVQDAVDTILVGMIGDLRASAYLLNEAYKKGIEAKKDYRYLEKSKKDVDQDLKRCQDRSGTYN